MRLTELLPNLEQPNDCGRPLTPIQQVCITLGYFGGGQLTRIAGLCGGVSQKAAWWAIRRVTSELADLKGQVIRMPTDEECEATARRLEGRYHLPGFAFGVDGTVVKFEVAPREIPDDTVQQDFWCRKMHYAINCQIVGNDEGLILDLNADWQGSTNDARIWANSPGSTSSTGSDGFWWQGTRRIRPAKRASRRTVLLRPLRTHQSASSTKGIQACGQGVLRTCTGA